MGIFDYCCIIEGESCCLRDSQGQDCTFGSVYLVNKNLTKKILAEYSGYGYVYIEGIEVYDLGNDYDNDPEIKKSYIACTECAKNIEKIVDKFDDLSDDESIEVIKKKKLDYLEKELNNLIIKREQINKLIEKSRKDIWKVKKLDYLEKEKI